MKLVSDTATNPDLLRMVADWGDDPAWARFHACYDPLLQSWCHAHGLDVESADEVCQHVWIELAERMRTFRYDPDRTFRGWLRRLCESRAIDFLRRRRRAAELLGLDECVDPRDNREVGAADESREGRSDDARPDGWAPFLAEARTIQDAIKQKIQPRTWEAFWLVAVHDWTVESTAQSLGMTRIAVYAARYRVARMLKEEGDRVSGRLTPGP